MMIRSHILTGLLLLAAITGCGSSEGSLVGNWQINGTPKRDMVTPIPVMLTFASDQHGTLTVMPPTGIYGMGTLKPNETYPFSYEVKSNTFIIDEGNGKIATFDYTIKDNTLKINQDGSQQAYTYTRQ